jgi:hypothetical protein
MQAKVITLGPGAFFGEDVNIALSTSACEKVCHGISGQLRVHVVGGAGGGSGNSIWNALTFVSKSVHTLSVPLCIVRSSGIIWAFLGLVNRSAVQTSGPSAWERYSFHMESFVYRIVR